MSTYIEDSPRNLAKWAVQSHKAGHSQAVVLTPWASPYVHQGGPGHKAGLGPRTDDLRRAEVPFWFDPVTHALQMSGVGDYRYYSEFNLWGGPRGDLTEAAYREEHVRRVFRVQREIGARLLAPAPLLPTGLSNLSTLALDTARAAMEQAPDAFLTIAGTATFWANGNDLDAHVGSLASLRPAGWFLSFVQPANDLPPALRAEEIFGVCRTVRALSEYAPVHISHGDFAALPAVAAGATSVGTGWDKRQRVMAYTDYGPRLPAGGIGSWYERPTLLGLLSTLNKRDGATLQASAPRLVTQLGGMPTPGAHEAFAHHVAQLYAAVERVRLAGGYEERFNTLDQMYTEASRNWAVVQATTRIRDRSSEWVVPLQQGLRMFAQSEGWIL